MSLINVLGRVKNKKGKHISFRRAYIPTFETVKVGHFIHFVTTEEPHPTMIGAEGGGGGECLNFRQLKIPK